MKVPERLRKGKGTDAPLNEMPELPHQSPLPKRSAEPVTDNNDDDLDPEDYNGQMFPSNYRMETIYSSDDDSRDVTGRDTKAPPFTEDPTVKGSNISEVQTQKECQQDKTNHHGDPSSVGMSRTPHTIIRSRRSMASTHRRREMRRREEERKFKRTICLVIAAVIAWCVLAGVVGGILATLL